VEVELALKQTTGRDYTVAGREDIFPAIARAHSSFYEDRLAAGRAMREAEAAADAEHTALIDMGEDVPLPAEPASVADILREKSARQLRNQEREAIGREMATLNARILRLEEELALAKGTYRELATKEGQLGARESTDSLDVSINEFDCAMATYKDALKAHGEREFRRNREIAMRKDLKVKEEAHRHLERVVQALNDLPGILLSTATLPVPGMVVSGEDIFLPEGEGLVPLDAFGEAKVLEFCVQIAMALAPAPFIVVDGLERCDTATRTRIYDSVRAAGFQLVSTRVTDGPLTITRVEP
jgi:hypothetical protein